VTRTIYGIALLFALAACGSVAESREAIREEPVDGQILTLGESSGGAEGMVAIRDSAKNQAMKEPLAPPSRSAPSSPSVEGERARPSSRAERAAGTPAQAGDLGSETRSETTTPPASAANAASVNPQHDGTGSASAAADGEPAGPPPAELRRIPAGTLLTFEVQRDLSTASTQVGEAFVLVLVDAVTGEGGGVLPVGTRAQGIVTDARRSTGPSDESLLAVRVASVEVAGQTMPFNGQVISAQVESSARASGARTAATVVTGSAAGAAIGRILGGDRRSTAAGAAVGTVIGTAVALSSRGGDAVLPAGSIVVVRLDGDLVY
jgi:hypothetical protein